MEEESRLKLESLLDSEEKKVLCERELRSLELRAYGALLTAFRAGGELDEEKRDTLSIVRQNLKISEARHKLEVRRVATDPLLCRIADSINGFNTVQDWRDEGFIELPCEKVINRLSTRSLSRRIKNEEQEKEEENEMRGRGEEIEPWRRHPTRVQVGSTLNVSPTLKRHQKVKKTIKELTATNIKTEEPPPSLSISSRFKNIQNGWGNINRNTNVINKNIDDDGEYNSEDSDIDNNKSKMTPLLTHLKQVTKLHEMEKKTIDSSSDTESSQEISIESLKRKGKLKLPSHKRPLKQLKEKQVTVRRKSQIQQQQQHPYQQQQHVNQPLQHQQQYQQPQQQQQQLIRKPKSPAKLQKLHRKKKQILQQQKHQFVGDKNLPTNLQLHRASPDIIDAPISPVKSGVSINANINNVTNTMNVVATNISIQPQNNESRNYDVPRGPKRKSSKLNPKSKLGITKRFKKVHHPPQEQIDRMDDQGDDEEEEEEEEENVAYKTKTLLPIASSSSSSSNKNNNRKVLHKVKIRRKPKTTMNDRIRHLNKEDELPDSPSSSDLRNEYHQRPKIADSRFETEGGLHPNYHPKSSRGPMYARPSATTNSTSSGSRRGLSKTRGARGTVGGSRRGSGTSRGRTGKNGGPSRSSHELKQNQRTVKPRINQSKRKQLDEIRVELKSESESDMEHHQHHRKIEKELLERRMAMQKTLDLEHQLTMRRLANMGNKSGDIDLDMDAELDEFEKNKLARMNIAASPRLRTPDRIDNERGNILKTPEKYPKYINDRGGSNYDQSPSSSTIITTTSISTGENIIPQQRNSKDRSPIRKPIKKYIKSDNDDENMDDNKSDEEDRNRGKDNYHRSSRENSKTPTPGENGGGDSSSSQSQSQSQSKQQQRESSPASSTTSEKDNSSCTSSKSKIATPSKIPVVPRAPLPAPVFSTSLDKETFNKKRQKILQNFTSGADTLTSSTTASSLARRAPIFSSTASSTVVGVASGSGTTPVSGVVPVLTKPPGILPQRKAQPHILVNSKAQRNLNAAAAAANANNNNSNSVNPVVVGGGVGGGSLTSSGGGGVIGASGVTTIVSSNNSVINTTSIINGTSISSIGINNNPPGVTSLINQGLTTTTVASGAGLVVGSNSSTILGSHHQQQQQQPTATLGSLSSMTNAIPVKTSQGANIIFLQKAGGGSSTTNVTSQIGGLSNMSPTMAVGALGMQHGKKAIIMRRPLNLPNRQGNVMILDVPKNPNQVISPQYLQTARILSSSGDLTLLANYQNQGGVNQTTVRKIMGAQVSTTPSLSSAASTSIVSPSITSTTLHPASGNFSVNPIQMNLQHQEIQQQQQPTVITTSAGGSKYQAKRLNRVFPPKDVIKVSTSLADKRQRILNVPISTTEISSKGLVPSIVSGNNLQIQMEPDTIQMIPEVEAPYYEEEVVTTSTNVVSSSPNDNNTTNIIPASLTFPSPIKISTNSSSVPVGSNVLSFNITKDSVGDNINMNLVGESEIVVENSLNLFESCMSDNGTYPSSSSDPTQIMTTLTSVEDPNNSNLPNLIINNNSGNNNVSNLLLPSSSSNINNNNNNSTSNQIIDTTGEISRFVMTNFKDPALVNQEQNSRQPTCILSTSSSSGRVDSSLSLGNNNLQHNQQPDSSTINLIQRSIPTSTSIPLNTTASFEPEEFNFDTIVEMDVESETVVQSNHETELGPDATATQVVLIDNSVPQPDIITSEHYVTISTTPSSSSMAISQSQSSDVSSSLPLTEDIFSTALNRSGINFTDLNEEGNVANVETVVTFQEQFPFVTSEQGQIKTTYTTTE